MLRPDTMQCRIIKDESQSAYLDCVLEYFEGGHAGDLVGAGDGATLVHIDLPELAFRFILAIYCKEYVSFI